MGQDSPTIGAEELAILGISKSAQKVTAREVAEHFAHAGKARTTVLTAMERLRIR